MTWRSLSQAEKAKRIKDAIARSDVPISARQIAERVGAPSRCSIISCCARYGIALPVQPSREWGRQ